MAVEACVAGGINGGGMHGTGCVWQERRPLKWEVCNLLECILVLFMIILLKAV